MKSYLIQEGKFSKMEKSEINGINSLINFNYMGSAEFEFGALPKSLKRMMWKNSEYGFFKIKNLKNTKTNQCARVFCRVDLKDETIKEIERISQNKYGYKETCHFADRFKNVKSYGEDINFWWDIDNDFMFFFGEDSEKMIKTAFIKMKERNVLTS